MVSFKPIAVFVVTWTLTGLGAIIGSVLSHGAGKPGLLAGAVLGGVLGIGTAVVVLGKLQWLAPGDRRGAFVGGIVGFAVAAPIAVSNLHTPIIPILTCALTGLGLLLGVRVARGWRRTS